MNDAVTFAMLWFDLNLEKGYRVYCNRDEMSKVSWMYDDWCENFYKGNIWEYDTPDHTELVLSMSEYINNNI